MRIGYLVPLNIGLSNAKRICARSNATDVNIGDP